MQIKPIASPHAIQQPVSNAANLKAKAIAAFNAASAQPQAPQQPSAHPQGFNQQSVAPEDISAIRAKTQQEEPQQWQGSEQSPQGEWQQPDGQSDSNGVSEGLSATEATVQEKKQPTPEDSALSRQFAQVARQERALRAKAQQQEAAFKAREEALKAREAELASKDQQYQSGYIQSDKLKSNPLAVLAEMGISYDELTQQLINTPATDPRVEATISRLESKIRELEAQNETSKKAAAEQQTAAYQAAVKQIRSDVKQLVTSDPMFETVKAANAINDVVDLITQTYDKDGILLSVEEAASQVEDYLIEEATKLAKLNKIKSRLGLTEAKTAPKAPSAPAQPTSGVTQGKQQQPPTMKTLTNAAASTRKLNARERAIAAFKGELK